MAKIANVCGWDFRANEDSYADENAIVLVLKDIAKEWVFQLEQGNETGYRHWQGRMKLLKKSTKGPLLKKLPKMNYLQPTSAGVHSSNNFNYVLKDDTRVKGPWKSIDYVNKVERKGLPPIYEEWDGDELPNAEMLYPFQKKIVESGNEKNCRAIDIIACKEGNKGKSTIMDYIIKNGFGIRIPPTVNNADDIMQMLYCKLESNKITDPRIIIIDLPRAINQDKLTGIFTACEEIKNGWCYDKRYNYKEKKFKSPRIWIFMNQVPNITWLSKDRWNIWDINNNKELVKIDIDKQNNNLVQFLENEDCTHPLDQ